MRVWLFMVLMLILFGGANAIANVDIQYALPSVDCVTGGCFVTGVSRNGQSFVSEEGYGLITLTGVTADQIIWPVPAGCSTGDETWSRVTDPNGVTASGSGLAVRTGLIFFHSSSPLAPGCYPVGSKKQVKALVDQLIVAGVIAQDQNNAVVDPLNWHWGWYYARCGDAPTNQNCIDWKAKLNIMLTRYPSRPQGLSAATDGAILTTDEANFLNAQCAAQPSGPFC